MSERVTLNAKAHPAAGTDRPGEFVCSECGRRCTRGPSGVEYGHSAGHHAQHRCSQRPSCVDAARQDA